jgi:peroxiredoxin
VAQARRWGLSFPIAYNRQWKTLDSWWLARRESVPTSPTFVIDATGRIAHVHPGPEFHASADAEHGDCNRDFEAVRAAIREAVRHTPR